MIGESDVIIDEELKTLRIELLCTQNNKISKFDRACII